MSKQIKCLFLFMIIMYPFSVRADIDFLSIIQEQIDTGQKKVEEITNKYIGDLSLGDLKNIAKGDFSSLKDMGTSFLTEQAELLGKSFANEMLAQYVYSDEIGKHIKGSSMNPELVDAIGKNMARVTNAADDVQKTMDHNKKINDMLVENVATMYATAIVKRKKLMDEQEDIQKEEEANLEKTPDIIAVYKSVSQRANSRWIAILEMMSNVENQRASKMTAETRIMDEEAAKKELDAALAEEQRLAQQTSATNTEYKEDLTKRLLGEIYDVENELRGGYNKLYSAYNDVKNVKYDLESGNYLDALSLSGRMYDSISSEIKYDAIGTNGEVIGYVNGKGVVYDMDGIEIGEYNKDLDVIVNFAGKPIGNLKQKNGVQNTNKTDKNANVISSDIAGTSKMSNFSDIEIDFESMSNVPYLNGMMGDNRGGVQ